MPQNGGNLYVQASSSFRESITMRLHCCSLLVYSWLTARRFLWFSLTPLGLLRNQSLFTHSPWLSEDSDCTRFMREQSASAELTTYATCQFLGSSGNTVMTRTAANGYMALECTHCGCLLLDVTFVLGDKGEAAWVRLKTGYLINFLSAAFSTIGESCMHPHMQLSIFTKHYSTWATWCMLVDVSSSNRVRFLKIANKP